jgi:cytochrome bd ubiquinol oxidase subunit II
MDVSSATILPLLWAMVIVLGIMIYIILDGFSLGIGILFAFNKNENHKDLMIKSISPFWDGNQTWLIMGGVGLFAAFPKAYGYLLSTLYLPIILLLIALIFRGITFEYRYKITKYKKFWDICFAISSTVATFVQGCALGTFIDGFSEPGTTILPTTVDWFTPFNILCGFALICGYALIGSTWLIMKTEGKLQEWCNKKATILLFMVLTLFAIISFWTPYKWGHIADKWFSYPNFLFLIPVPIHIMGITAIFLYALFTKKEYLPFIMTIALFIMAYTGLAITLWPYIIPHSVTIWDAAAPPESLLFGLTGVLILLPIVIAYNVHTYWVFRGKVTIDTSGYN